jgi:GT2 family glycosyltransferase
MRASIVIVTWNSEAEIAGLLESITEWLDASWDVFVVDNASSDHTVAQVRGCSLPVHLTCLDENIGFGAANNLALRSVSTSGTVLLNPDTVLIDDSLRDLVRLSMNANCIVGPRLLNEDLSIQPSASCPPASLRGTLRIFLPGRAMPTRWASMLEPWRARTTIRAGWLSGACVAAPTSLLRRLGPFDEAIHLYGEDMDLGLRAEALQIPRLFAPDVARVVHLGDRSSGQRFSDAGLALSVQNRRAVVRTRMGRAREKWDDVNELGLTLTRLAGKRLIGADTTRQRSWLRARFIGRSPRR